jgi:glycosyltransferase involved in cell wall biosynthesis
LTPHLIAIDHPELAKAMKPLRFCHVTTFYPPHNFGGDGINIQRLCRALVRRGHHSTVLYDPDAFHALRNGPAPAEDREADGVEVISLRGLGSLPLLLNHQLGRPVIKRRQIERVMALGGFDVIQFHNVSLMGGPGIFRMGNATKLYMAHDHWLICPTHVLWRHQKEPCPGRECLRCVLRHHRPPQAWRYTHAIERAAKYIDAFIALSEFSRRKHREFGFCAKMEVLPCFLPDPEPLEAATNAGPRPHPRPYFIFAGRLEASKGVDEIVAVFRHQAEADLLIAGDGERASELGRLAAGCAQIRFLGRLSIAELDRYYRHAIAALVPSMTFETFGNVLIEAFRAGVPVIARRMGPFPEIIGLAQGGELFSTREELVEAIRHLQRDTAVRERLARNAIAAYRAHWTEAVVIPRYLEIVRQAARHRGAKRMLATL